MFVILHLTLRFCHENMLFKMLRFIFKIQQVPSANSIAHKQFTGFKNEK